MNARRLLPLLLLLATASTQAQTEDDYQIWLTTGFWSHHFERDKGFKENNTGAGLQVTLDSEKTLSAGVFKNSDYQQSHYLGLIWQPWQLGPAKLGLWAGALDGYPDMQNGNWFLAAFPMASFEYKAVGMNLTVMPTYKHRLHGAVIAQFKLKVW